jgi:hypothetical protein
MEVSVLKAIENIQESNQQIKNEVSQLSRSMSISGSAGSAASTYNWQAKNQAPINVLVGALSRTTENQRRSQANQMVIDSIYFTTTAERRSKIPAAYTKTFQWMFVEGPRSTIQWTNFAAWCRNRTTNDRLYWIAGKPRSGSPHLCDIYRTILVPERSCRFGPGPENYWLQAVFSGTPAPLSRSLKSAYCDLCYMVFYNNVQNTQPSQHLGDGGHTTLVQSS